MSTCAVHSKIPGAPDTCRLCGGTDFESVVDLGKSPLCESFLGKDDLGKHEVFYPLHLFICLECSFVQLKEFVSGEDIFNENYSYFSSYSTSWLEHCRAFVESISRELQLTQNSYVVELASNDGYLLKNFVERGIPCLGIEPARKVAEVAMQIGVPTMVSYFGVDVAEKLDRKPDLILGNNVLAHVPDLHDFAGGIRILMKDDTVLVIEVPHLLRLVAENQFDTIYHEHFSYFTLASMTRLFEQHGMSIFRVEELATHGGSIRVYAQLKDGPHATCTSVAKLMRTESSIGMHRRTTYRQFAGEVVRAKWQLVDMLLQVRKNGLKTVGYGAPGKGNTLLNYCGIRSDLIEYVVDRNPHKHGMYLPGSQIPIFPVEKIQETKPDYIVILPWNLSDEILHQLRYAKSWGARFIIPIPHPHVL